MNPEFVTVNVGHWFGNYFYFRKMEDENQNNNENQEETPESYEIVNFDGLGKQELEKHLVKAAKHGILEVVKSLLKRGASADAKEYNRCLFYASVNYVTPLQNAVIGGFNEIAQYLIEHEGKILICMLI